MLCPFMELEIFHRCHLRQQTTPVWHCRIPAGPGLVRADNGITRVYTGVPAKGSATGRAAGKEFHLLSLLRTAGILLLGTLC